MIGHLRRQSRILFIHNQQCFGAGNEHCFNVLVRFMGQRPQAAVQMIRQGHGYNTIEAHRQILLLATS
jgi:hypothetical protein